MLKSYPPSQSSSSISEKSASPTPIIIIDIGRADAAIMAWNVIIMESSMFQYFTWVDNGLRYVSVSYLSLHWSLVQGVPKNMGIQWRIRYRLCYELAL